MNTATGTRPPGTSDEQQAAQWVQQMFADIAPRYDFLNHLLSFNIDRLWRKKLIKCLSPALKEPASRVLDLCCGTGDVLLEMQKIAAMPVFGADFCHPMLVTAQAKGLRMGFKAPLFEGDALQLPVAGHVLDAISIAFGFRNLTNYDAGLRELNRVLKPGGVLAILEFSQPARSLLKVAYGFYSRFILPSIGWLVSGRRGAYVYLPESIRKFPDPEELCRMMGAAGFVETRFELLTGGIAALHTGLAGSTT